MDAGLLLLHVRNVVDRRVELWRIVVDIPDVDDNDGQVGELVIEHAVLQFVYLRDDRVRINNNSGSNVKVSSNIDHFTLRTLADLLLPTSTRLLLEAFSHAAITAQRLHPYFHHRLLPRGAWSERK